jgi:ribosomal protein S18 acetylase RimI-like enzyme
VNVTLREATRDDEALLWDMLHLAVFVPPGAPAVPKAALAEPDLARYVSGWGRVGDAGVIAMTSIDEPVGAAWLRLWSAADRGYGFVDLQTPELTIAVRPAYRGRGVGTRLLDHLLQRADRTCGSVSLSVSVLNPARRLYSRFGFIAVGGDGHSTTMRRWRGAGDKASAVGE